MGPWNVPLADTISAHPSSSPWGPTRPVNHVHLCSQSVQAYLLFVKAGDGQTSMCISVARLSRCRLHMPQRPSPGAL